MQNYIYSLLVLLSFSYVINAADSDGKDFVFSFIESYDDTSAFTSLSAIIIPSYNDSICTFKYTQASDKQVVSIQTKALYGKTNEIFLPFEQVILKAEYVFNHFKNFEANDFRLFASCTEEVKLLARYQDPYYMNGDMYVVPSIPNAGNKYIFSVPTQTYPVKGFISILPISQENNITLTIVGYVNGVLFSNETTEYDTTIGKPQHYITIMPLNIDNYNSSISISANMNFMLTYVTPIAATSNNEDDGSCGKTCGNNYVAFMPVPVVSKKCNQLLSSPDLRLMTNDFTTRLHISPPSVDYNCNEDFSMDVYDKEGNVDHKVISKTGLSLISLVDQSEIGSSTNAGEMPVYRFGSILNHPDNLTAYGHFAHYVPSVQEWVTGKTQFYTLAKNCFIEFYADQDGSNTDFIKLDGLFLSKYPYTSNKMNYFKRSYGHIIVPVSGYGLHTFENGGKYVMYVICKTAYAKYDSSGYLTGFNRRKPKFF
uniref:IgGFc_binding domain-containing protein n=1 Tax=Rhabditophanes sp. KR3021 TaxID=114890 RepID=A0AC35TS51_9BILA